MTYTKEERVEEMRTERNEDLISLGKSKELKQAVDYGAELIQMYQSGFLDGYKCKRPKMKHLSNAKIFLKIAPNCKVAFEKRYAMKIQKKITERGKKNGRTSNRTAKKIHERSRNRVPRPNHKATG